MAMEYKFGLTGPNMKGNGNTERLTEKESLLILTAMFITASGKMIKHKVMEFICITMGRDTKDIGMRTISMDMGSRHG